MGEDDVAQFEALVAGAGRLTQSGAAAMAAIGQDGDRYVQVSPALNKNGEWILTAVEGAGDKTGTVLAELVAAGRDLAVEKGSTATRWWATSPTYRHEQVAARCGFSVLRGLFFMHVDLPLPKDGRPPLNVRVFRPGPDDEGFLEVNNAAFNGHPEQGNWTKETLEARMSEPWFDAMDLLVHEVEGQIAGFCWTKVHRSLNPQEGEIFVIAAHPDFHGRGLGRALTRAGLDHLALEHHLRVGQLYVDEANEPALGLYRALGFSVTRADRCYQWTAAGL